MIFAEPSGGASGQASDIAIHAKEILRVREVLTGIYQKHCSHEGESVQEGVERFRTYFYMACTDAVLRVVRDRESAGEGLLHDG